MNGGEVNFRNLIVGNEISANFVSRIELFPLWHRFTIEPFQPNLQQMIAVDGFDIRRYLSHPILYNEISHIKYNTVHI